MSQPSAPAGTPLTVLEAFRALRRFWIGPVVLVLVGLLAGYGYSRTITPTYSSSSQGLVTSAPSGNASETSVADSLARSRAKTYVDLANSGAVAPGAKRRLGYAGGDEDLQARVTTTTPEGSIVVEVAALGSSPQDAQTLADAWMTELVAQIDRFEGRRGGRGSFLTLLVTRRADLPGGPITPPPWQMIAVGGLVGLLAGLAYAIVRHRLDQRISGTQTIRQRHGLNVLGSLPQDVSFQRTRVKDALEGEVTPALESVRKVRTSLRFANVDDPPRCIVVTSAAPGEGKSTVAAQLAIAMAAGGDTVVLIDADLRRPMQASNFGLVTGAGLTDVLIGRAKASEVLQPVDSAHKLFLLGAGQAPPNPSELLGSQAMHRLLDDLADKSLVILDAPPLLPVTDAAVLTANADGCLVVVTQDKTTHPMLTEALQNLESVGADVLGVVLNRTERRKGSAYAYDYKQKAKA